MAKDEGSVEIRSLFDEPKDLRTYVPGYRGQRKTSSPEMVQAKEATPQHSLDTRSNSTDDAKVRRCKAHELNAASKSHVPVPRVT